MVIAVPNFTSTDAGYYKEYWAAYDVPRHLYHFSPKGIELLFKSKGFILQAQYPMWFDSFYVSILSEQYKSGTGNLPGALLRGFISNIKALSNKKGGSSMIYIFSKNQ